MIIDVEALEAVETIGESGGPDLASLLAAHEDSALAGYGFREWLLLEHPGVGAPTRIVKRWSRIQAPVLRALGAAD